MLREISAFGDERADARVAIEVKRIDPRQLVPDLQVPQVLAGEPRGRRKAVDRRWQRPPALRQKFGVPRVDIDHPLALGVKKVVERKLDVPLVERRGIFETDFEVPIARTISGKCLELHQERWHQIERHPHLGKLAQERDHAVVILQCVEPHPREDVLVCHEVLVERLVHVPQDGDAGHSVSV